MKTQQAKKRLEYLRQELRGERISYGELFELQSLIPFIEPDDVELLEAAGVPEFPEDETKSIQIPFDGLYESHAENVLDSVIEGDAEYLRDEKGYEMTDRDYSNIKYDFDRFARLYVDLYTDWLKNEFDISIDIEFDELISPREYNFGTDRIYCKVSNSDLRTLYTRFMADEDGTAQERINERFKSRSGFASFYDDFCSDWKTKPFDQWDDNELAILFPDPYDTEDGYIFFYDDANCNGYVSECVQWPEHVNELF